MPTGAMFWRQEQSFVDRSHVVAIETILEVVRVDKGKMLSTEAMSTGAVFCRQEPCCGDSIPGGCPCRQGQDVWAAWELGAPVWAAWELLWTAWGSFDMATRWCFVDRSNVDRSIPGGRSSSWGGLRGLFRRPGGLSGQPRGLGSLSGRPGRLFQASWASWSRSKWWSGISAPREPKSSKRAQELQEPQESPRAPNVPKPRRETFV